MASSHRRLVPTAGAPPPPSVMHTTPWERQPLTEVGDFRTVAQEVTPPLPWDENSEAIILEHEEKVNKYQAVLAEYLKAKYSMKDSDKGGRSLQPNCAAVPKSRSRLPQANNSREAKDVVHEENQFIREAEDLDHEEKINKYQAILAARLKAKYFSGKDFDKGLRGDMFEEITIESETIRISRYPFTSLFADPAKFCLEKRGT